MSGDVPEANPAGELPAFDDGGRLPALHRRTWAFLLSAALLGGAFAYDYLVLEAREPIVFGWDLAAHEWLFALSLDVALFYLVVPLAIHRKLAVRYWRRLRATPVGLASFLYLVGFFVVGMVGPAVLGEPRLTMAAPYQPPLFLGVPLHKLSTCSAKVVGSQCYGTLAHPLGTTANSQDVLVYVVSGMRLAIEVAFVSAMLLVPIPTVVGTAAAEFGGRVDDVLMRYVDLLQVVPAFFVYIVVQYVYEPSLTVMLLLFGGLSWGSIARLVRSEALQKREAQFIRAAENAGASRLSIVRNHLVPNVSNTAVTAATLQIPTLVLVEAALSYLALGDPDVTSLGWLISSTTNPQEFPVYWWLSTTPVVVLLLTIVALNLFGDALRDVLDPRARH